MASNFCAVMLQGKVASEPQKCNFRGRPVRDRNKQERAVPQETAVRFYLNVARFKKGRDGEDGAWMANHIMIYLFGAAAERALEPNRGFKVGDRLWIEGVLDKFEWTEMAGTQEKKRSLAIVRTFGFAPGGQENVNRVIVMGKLSRDPDVKYFDSGSCKTSFSIGVDRRIKMGEDDWSNSRSWNDITMVGKASERAGEFLRKDSGVLVDGWLETESWQDKDTQKKVSKTVIKAFDFVFAGEGGGQRVAAGDMPPMPSDEEWGAPPDDYYGEYGGGPTPPPPSDEIPF